jgi:uncharacterized protein YbjT (DUF2867 family)
MRVILFGATGMIGQGVLRECLLDPGVEEVLSIGRSATGNAHAKLRELVRADLLDLAPIESTLEDLDACFFCLGVTSLGMTEADYRRVTRDIALAAAEILVRQNPGMTFVFVSGAGADSTERGGSMWARVKGETENALLRLPFKAVYIFRPAFVQPLHGVKSKTTLYRVLYTLLRPLIPLLTAKAPKYVTTTEQIGRAMLLVARQGAPKRVLESADINDCRPAA